MSARALPSMDDELLQVQNSLVDRLIERCKAFPRTDSVACREELQKKDANGTPRLLRLLFSLPGLSPNQLRALVRDELPMLPAGLRANLIVLLMSVSWADCCPAIESDMSRKVEALAAGTGAQSAVRLWKEGTITLASLLATLPSLVSQNTLSGRSLCAISQLLVEHNQRISPSLSSALSQSLPRSLQLSTLAFDDLHQLLLLQEPQGAICLRACDGREAVCSSSGELLVHTKSSPANRCAHCPQLWWVQDLRGEGFHTRPNLLAGPSAVCLTIGGRLDCGTGQLDIDFVVDVDARVGCGQWMDVVVIVHGRFRSALERCSGSTDNDDDGDTEVYAEDDLQSPNESAESGEQRFMSAPCDQWAQYFVVTATCWTLWAKVGAIQPLRRFLHCDQIPFAVLYPAPDLILMRGSHGLVAVLDSNPGATDWRVRSLGEARDWEEGDAPSTHHTGHDLFAVTAWDYGAANGKLVTADYAGGVCLWAPTASPPALLARCNPIGYGQAIQMVALSPQGRVIVCGLWDRCIVLQFPPVSPSSPSLVGQLVECAVLDTVPQRPCKYSASFETDQLFLWRVCAPAYGDNGLSLFHWKVSLDSLAEPQGSVLASTSTSTSSHHSSSSTTWSEVDQDLRVCQVNQEWLPVMAPATLCLSSSLQAAAQSPRPLQLVSFDRKSPRSAFLQAVRRVFIAPCSALWRRACRPLAVLCSAYQPPQLALLAAALEEPEDVIRRLITVDLAALVEVGQDGRVRFVGGLQSANAHLTVMPPDHEFVVDKSLGHTLLCALYLRLCANKSLVCGYDLPWQQYLLTFGPLHLRHSSRALREYTSHVRKIDETANIRGTLPPQLGYISGLQEIYARRVGLGGPLPEELCELRQLRVLSLGNNALIGSVPEALGRLKQLQRIVLHQNNLSGTVPSSLGQLGCIVNLAGNPRLDHGADVPAPERNALEDLFRATGGTHWCMRSHWCSAYPVSTWYKVGVLCGHVHSLVMSSNGMVGRLPEELSALERLRMIELATMPGLTGPLPRAICQLTALRRLCICRCDLTGPIPPEIGNLVGLEELQLFGNRLTGSIPPSLGQLVNLKLLSLGEYTGGNCFNPEPLPSCLQRLVNLEALFLANCHLRGSLPTWLGELKELRQLDLQRNLLTGPLPSCVGQLQHLLYLNLKDNAGLSGRLPLAELCSLTKLNRLSLVHCGFTDKEQAHEVLKEALPRCKIWL